MNEFVNSMETAFSSFDLAEIRKLGIESTKKVDRFISETTAKFSQMEEDCRNNTLDLQYILSDNFVNNLFGNNANESSGIEKESSVFQFNNWKSVIEEKLSKHETVLLDQDARLNTSRVAADGFRATV